MGTRSCGPAMLAVGALCLVATPARGQSEPAPASGQGADSAQHDITFQLHGFLLGAGSIRTTGERPPGGEGGDIVLGETRLRLDVDATAASGAVTMLAKGDVLYDFVSQAFAHDIREAYGGLTRSSYDARVGRQIVTWGLGDLLFVNDVFPKDWNSYFSGRPMEYLKLGVDGARVKWSSSAISADIVVVPVFTSDEPPAPKRFSYMAPLAAIVEHETKPHTNFANTEVAVRLYRQTAGLETSFYAHRGFWRTPSLRFDQSPVSATQFYPALSTYGVSVQRGFGAGVLGAEVGYYDSRDDRAGIDPAVPNSQWRFLAAYQYQPWRDATVAFQAYGEVTKDVRALAQMAVAPPPPDRLRGVFSIRFVQQLRYQIWRPSVFVAYSPTDKDVFVRPELGYKVTENLSLTAGANRFAGASTTTFFGQFKKDNNVFVDIRFDF